MITTAALMGGSGLAPDDLSHWGDLISTGSGYVRTSIVQKRRRPRVIYMPAVGLDRLLKQLRLGLAHFAGYVPPEHVHGFVKGRDIFTNAAQHLDQDVVLKVDLADFFGAIDRGRVLSAMTDFGFDPDCGNDLARVAVIDGSIAQGFSTSPILSNLAFFEADQELADLARRSGVQFTRYVDDLIFSGTVDAVDDKLLELVTTLLNAHGWAVNGGKTRFMRRGKAQYVTGLYVGDSAGPHIPRSMKRLLRREVYYAARFGADDARQRSHTPIEFDRLSGWVHYAAHSDPSFGIPLREQWSRVVANRHQSRPVQDWDTLLDEIDFPSDW